MKRKPLWRIKLDILCMGYIIIPKRVADYILGKMYLRARRREINEVAEDAGDLTVICGQILTK